MNTKYQSKHNHLLYNCYLWVICFNSLESASGPTKNRSKVSRCIVHSGVPNDYKIWCNC